MGRLALWGLSFLLIAILAIGVVFRNRQGTLTGFRYKKSIDFGISGHAEHGTGFEVRDVTLPFVQFRARWFGHGLHRHCSARDIEEVKQALANGGNVNANDGIGRTPVSYAVARDHSELVGLLLENGADCRSMYMYSLKIAIGMDYVDVLNQFSKHKAQLPVDLIFEAESLIEMQPVWNGRRFWKY